MVPIIVLYWASVYSYIYILSAYSSDMGATASMVGMITGAYGLVQLFCRIPIGILSDYRENQRKFFFFGVGSSLLAAVGLYFAKTPVMLMLFSALSGVAVSTWAVFMSGYCTFFPPEKTTRVVGSLNVMTSSGQLIGTFGSGLVAQVFGTKRASFVVAAAVALLVLLMLLFVEDTYQKGAAKQQPKDFIAVVTQDKTLRFFSVLAAILNFMNFAAINSFVPLILTNLGASSMQISLGSTASVLASVISTPFSCTIMKDKLGVKTTTMIGFILLALSMFLFPRVQSISAVIALEAVSGLGRGLMFSLLMACATEKLSPQLRSTGMGTFQAIYAVGMFLGPAIAGVAIDVFSFSQAFTAMSVICVLVAGYLGLSKRVKVHV